MKSRFIKLLGTVALINIMAKFFGFAREVIIGYQYGTTYQADSIITAVTIPNFLYLVLGGGVTTAFISVYSKLEGQKKHQFAQTIFTLLSVIIGLLTILFMVLPGFWIKLFFSGMSTEALDLTTNLFVWATPATLFLVLGIALSGLHNVYGNYRLSTFSTFLFNGIYLVIGVGLTPVFMEYSYALGITLGGAGMLTLLVIHIRKQQLMPLRFRLRRMPEVGRFVKLAIPLVLGGAIMQFYQFIQRIFAADLSDGLIASLNYATKMAQFPQAVLMASVTTIIYPMLAKAAGEGNTQRMQWAYREGFRMLAILLIPASLFIIFYAQEIISIVLQYGNFDSSATQVTYPLLQILAVSIFSLALNTYITRFFYAVEKTILPIVINLMSVFGINILVIVQFVDQLGSKAIALGTVVSAIVSSLLLLYFARRNLKLHVAGGGLLVKLFLYSLLASGSLWLISGIELSSMYVALLTGGISLLFIIGIGWKVVH